MEAYQHLSRSIQGRTALVTGAASGMGRATAHLFAREGAHVAVTDLDLEACQSVVDEIEAAGFATAKAWAMDMSDAAMIKACVGDIVAHFGGLDIVVNNAGFSMVAKIDEDAYPQAWEKSLAVMLEGPQLLIRQALPHLQKSDAARIVNISSTEGLGGSAGSSPYTAAKHGLIGLTKSLAVELGKQGITVNAVCPGPIHTGITQPIPDEHKATFAHRRTALRRYGRPEEVANMTLSLCLPASSYVTGVAIPVDGGMRARNN
ncbi:MAG: SDR family oxidoreductase [Rhodobiaceae bacterium]|jgi:3-oxoacyl-[acyl-carrier protein] reductase|nr:SDR family oxidoreductase [Rhodobiaceae bacterium]MBT5518410.1 SDR family oxidoreductase [Rhodobiaceae bacterium]MBT7279452.1 SDR family oxidoreductase [Rhodobiaceae bacterium]MDG2495214.1 SDR family NAD(P)-dependent oxidoreductase [Alphaproteobacteria bacterium]